MMLEESFSDAWGRLGSAQENRLHILVLQYAGDSMVSRIYSRLGVIHFGLLQIRVLEQLRESLNVRLFNQLYNQLGNQLSNQLSNQLYNKLWNQLGNQLYNQLRNQLYDQLRNQLRYQLLDNNEES